jgi:hypothetical protein
LKKNATWLFLPFCTGVVLVYFYTSSLSIFNKNSRVNREQKKETYAIFYYWYKKCFISEKRPFFYNKSTASNVKNVISIWLEILQREKLIDYSVLMQNCSLNENKTEVCVSFTKIFLDQNSSAFNKWNLLKSLFKTIHGSFPEIHKIVILIDQVIPYDAHIDFSQGFFINNLIAS